MRVVTATITFHIYRLLRLRPSHEATTQIRMRIATVTIPHGLCIVSVIFLELTVMRKLDSCVRTVEHPSEGKSLLVSFDSA